MSCLRAHSNPYEAGKCVAVALQADRRAFVVARHGSIVVLIFVVPIVRIRSGHLALPAVKLEHLSRGPLGIAHLLFALDDARVDI